MKPTILIFGISSFIGSNIAHQLKRDFRIIGTYHKNKVDIPGVLTLPCDVNNKDMVDKLLIIFKPQYTIYTIGLTNLLDCHDFPKVADALNTTGVFNVSNASERYHSKFIYFSSSYIFPGEDILYKENDTPLPLSTYGNSVASSEFYIQKSCLNYLIFRCCPIFGRSCISKSENWFEFIERKMHLNQRIICDNKVQTGFVDIWSLVEIVKVAIKENFTNRLFQISSSDVMTRYEFAQKYVSIFGGNESNISKGDWKFPRSEKSFGFGSHVGDQMKFHMNTFNFEDSFSLRSLSVEESLKKAHKLLSGKITSKGLNKNSGITFI